MAFTDFPNVSNCFEESSCMQLAMAINVTKKDPKHYILCQQFILIIHKEVQLLLCFHKSLCTHSGWRATQTSDLAFEELITLS